MNSAAPPTSRRAHSPSPGICAPAEFARLARAYRRATHLPVGLVDPAGRWLIPPHASAATADPPAARSRRRHAVAEALRWGEPCVSCDDRGLALWAMPVMSNQTLLGGLVVADVPLHRPKRPGALDRRILTACHHLATLAFRHNLANAALLAEHRQLARRERERAEALHSLKEGLHDDIRSIYLREEPALIAAIRRGERTAARGAINRVLAAIYLLGDSRTDLLKSMALELVVIMTRTAVQAGGDSAQILGLNYQSLTALARVNDQEQLAAWLCEMLELLIDAITRHDRHPNAVQLARAVEFMEQHLGRSLARDEVARAAGLSPSHFSHLMRAKTGASFTEFLTRLRIDRACHLLPRTELGLAHIAQTCGFGDQSYFTRVFRKAIGQTPGEYRRRPLASTSGPAS